DNAAFELGLDEVVVEGSAVGDAGFEVVAFVGHEEGLRVQRFKRSRVLMRWSEFSGNRSLDTWRARPNNRAPGSFGWFTHAGVAELADAQDSGSCDRKVVEVRLLSSALL